MTDRPSATSPRSIRAHLLALLAAFAVPLVGLELWSNVREYRLTVEAQETKALALAEATAASTRQFLTFAEGLLTGFAREFRPSLLSPEHCDVLVEPMNGVFAFFVNTLAVDAGGTVACSALELPSPGLNVGEQTWFQQARRAGRFSVGPPVQDDLSDTWVVHVAVPLVDEEGAPVGVLAGALPLLRFQDLLASVSLEPDDLVTVATGERVVLARSHEPERWIGRRLPPAQDVAEQPASDRWVAQGPDFDGVERAWGQVRVASVDWHIYVGMPADRVYGPAISAARAKAGVGLLCVAIALLLATSFYHRIARTLRDLVHGTRAAIDGSPVPVPPGAPAEVEAVVAQFNQTLEAQLRAERARRSALARYRSVFDNAVFGMYVSTPDGRFLETNPALVAMLGYPSQEALHAAGPQVLYADEERRGALVEEYRETGLIEAVEVEWLRHSGASIVVRLNGKVIRTEDGEPGFEVIVEDVTDEKRREEELRQTQKMEAVGRLAGGIAHDFNNLLTVIGGNVELLQASLAAEDPCRLDLDQIADAVERASGLTRQLLSFGRKERPASPAVNLNEIITTLEQLLGRLIGADIRLETLLEPRAQLVHGDVGQLEQVIMNLVINARDALPAGGHILVETRAIGPEGLPLRGRLHAEGVLLSVRDNGTGMDEETRQRIFEPFFTTKPKGEGTGLGLATVYGIVRQMGGHIHPHSELGRGTVFDIWLPRSTAAPGRERPVARHPSRPGSGTETILAVEDEEQVRGVVRRVLEGEGYEVLVACDGLEALELIEAYSGPIHLVLTDVVMPRVKGTELASRLASLRPEMPVMFMSGYTDNLPLDEHLRRDPDAFVAKPFRPRDLAEQVRSVLDRHAAVASD